MINRYTIRFYDLDFNHDFEQTFEKFKPVFKSRNPFFIECLKRGLMDFKREKLGNEKDRIDLLLNNMQNNLDKISQLGRLFEKKSNELYANAKAILTLSNSNQNILLNISKGVSVDKELLELGMYDKTSKRIEKIIEEILENYEI